MCLASIFGDEDIWRLDKVIGERRKIFRGEYLFKSGDKFRSLYALRSGSFKIVDGHSECREQIAQFVLPGENIGLGGIGADRYNGDAVALEDSSVCVIPYLALEGLLIQIVGLERRFRLLLSRELNRVERLGGRLNGMTSQQRVAAFLIDLSGRLRQRGYSPYEFTMRMTRQEIGSFLGVKLETVSRSLSVFQREGLLHVNGKNIKIFDPIALENL